MKSIFVVGLLNFALSSYAGDFVCKLLEGNQLPQEKRVNGDSTSTQGTLLEFTSASNKTLKIQGRYSSRLNSTDAEIVDLKTNYRALATDWGNDKNETSHASLVVNTPDGTNLILQCVKYN